MSARVLIVDDSLTVRMDLAEALEGEGLEVVLCSTLSEARTALTKSHFALILLDVVVPDGDGLELLAEIRSTAGADQPAVMLLSTEAEVRDRIRGLTTGADEYVGKPYDRGYVVARAHELLRRGGGGATPSPSSRATILVIDDSVTLREELRAALEATGYDVVTAGSGEEGLRLAGQTRPTAVIVDGVLPGIDGAAVIRHVRLDAALRRTPCVLLTGEGDRDTEIRAFDVGADAFVRKESGVEVVLARLTAVLRHGAASNEAETVSLQGPKKILAVDDSTTYRRHLADLLRGEGYEVVLASSGEEALELLAIEPVDCILLDMMMPGLGGEETCRRIKDAPVIRETPLLMLTAREDRDAMIRGLDAGADDFISKSGDFSVLKARLLAQIRRKQFEDETRRIRDQLARRERDAVNAQAAQELAETRARLLEDVERKNRELEAFSYSVSHDLRAPLRAITGFTGILVETFAERLGPEGREHLERVDVAAKRMSELIEALLELSRVGRAQLQRTHVDLAVVVRSVFAELRTTDPARAVELVGPETLVTRADPRLMRVLLENLLGNAWKFTRDRLRATIEFGAERAGGPPTYFVRDDGAGFDMTYASKLFTPFQRLHSTAEFPGTGIGLATVHRIVERHGGHIRAEGAPGRGASIYFTLDAAKPSRPGTS